MTEKNYSDMTGEEIEAYKRKDASIYNGELRFDDKRKTNKTPPKKKRKKR